MEAVPQWLLFLLVSTPGVVFVSVPALPPLPKPAPTPPVPAAPELVVMFFVVSVEDSVCPVLVAFSEQLINQVARPSVKTTRLIFCRFCVRFQLHRYLFNYFAKGFPNHRRIATKSPTHNVRAGLSEEQ
jgi:hypothetical protein